MLDIALIVLLVLGFFVGLKRGFIMQLFHLIGYIIAYIAANLYYNQLAPKLSLWIPYPNFGKNANLDYFANSTNMEGAFYRAIAFIIIFFAVKILLHMIGSLLNFIAYLPILRQLNIWAGGLLGFSEVYLILFIVLYIAALIPINAIQNPLEHSMMANTIVNHTPILSQQIRQLWTQYTTAGTSL